MEKQCRTCYEFKDLTEYHKIKNAKDGHSVHCRLCYNKKQREYARVKSGKTTIGRGYMDMKGGDKLYEWCHTYILLSKIGYNPSDDIHTQFIERHPNLVYKRRPAKSKKTYTWDQCDRYKKTHIISDAGLTYNYESKKISEYD